MRRAPSPLPSTPSHLPSPPLLSPLLGAAPLFRPNLFPTEPPLSLRMEQRTAFLARCPILRHLCPPRGAPEPPPFPLIVSPHALAPAPIPCIAIFRRAAVLLFGQATFFPGTHKLVLKTASAHHHRHYTCGCTPKPPNKLHSWSLVAPNGTHTTLITHCMSAMATVMSHASVPLLLFVSLAPRTQHARVCSRTHHHHHPASSPPPSTIHHNRPPALPYYFNKLTTSTSLPVTLCYPKYRLSVCLGAHTHTLPTEKCKTDTASRLTHGPCPLGLGLSAAQVP
jgi:hypothetical protein